MGEMDDIIKEFLIESNEGLDRLDRDLVELEKTPGAKELLASIFRSVHTVKGTGGVLGFDKLTSVAHVGENMLSRVRDGKLSLDPRVTTVLLSLVDALRKMLASIETTGSEGDGDYSGVIAAITAIVDGSSTPSSEAPLGAPAPLMPPLSRLACRLPLWPPRRRAARGEKLRPAEKTRPRCPRPRRRRTRSCWRAARFASMSGCSTS